MEDAIRYAKKYYFWPLSLIVLLLALYLWYGTVSSMDKEFTDRESALKQVNSSMSSISSTAPNEEVIQLIQKKCRSLKRDVSSAWNLLYEKQNANNTWPEITSNGKVVDFTARKVPQDGCEQYRYRIVEEFKSLVETLDLVASNTSESGGVAARAGAPVTGAANPNEYITEEVKPQTTDPSKKELVIWDEKSIDELSKSHFAWERIPKSNQILVAQEDFWLFKNIIDAIKSVNQGVETRNNAKLKMVKDIQITKQASDLFKQRQEKGFFDVANFKKASADNAGMLDTQGAPTIDGQSSTSDGGSGEPLNKEFRELYDWRYVDDNGAALTAEQYNTQKNVSETRNVPVYISLIINQSCLTDLMSSLINADKPVNIQLVLINPGKGWTPRFDFSRFEDADAASGDSGSTASAPRSSSRGRGRSSSSGSGFGNSDSGGMLRGGNANFAMEDDDVQVDIYGIIPLFNPPAPKRFPEIEQANEPEDEAAEEAAEEAASTATADGQSATSESGKDNSGTESGNSNSP